MRRAIALLVVLGFFAAALADGCGGDGKAPRTPTVPPGTTPVATNTATLQEVRMGEYSYRKSSNCEDMKMLDPITVVFEVGGEKAREHVVAHGLPQDEELLTTLAEKLWEGEQKFLDSGRCSPESIDQAECHVYASPTCLVAGRWHTRGIVAPEPDASGNRWAVGTPHRDVTARIEFAGVPVFPCHAVPARYNGVDGTSGFDAGRDWVVREWATDPANGHPFIRTQFWGNVLLMHQCNGDWAGSDGWVDFLEVERARP
jgi:hypothetical protein